MQEFFTNTVVPLMPTAVAFTAILAFVIMPILTVILNGQFSIKSVLGVVGLLVLLFIIYTMTPGEGWELFGSPKYADIASENINILGMEFKLMKYVETGIIATVILLATAIISWIGFSIVNFINRAI